FGKQQARVGLHRSLNGLRVAWRDHGDLDTKTPQHAITKLSRAPIAISRNDHVLARTQQSEQYRGDGAHPRSPQEGFVSVFEFGQLALSSVDGRIAIAPVLTLGNTPFLEINQFLGIAEHIGRGLIDRHCDGVTQTLLAFAPMYGTTTDALR